MQWKERYRHHKRPHRQTKENTSLSLKVKGEINFVH